MATKEDGRQALKDVHAHLLVKEPLREKALQRCVLLFRLDIRTWRLNPAVIDLRRQSAGSAVDEP